MKTGKSVLKFSQNSDQRASCFCGPVKGKVSQWPDITFLKLMDQSLLRHWSQFVPNVSTDIGGHEAQHHYHHGQYWLCLRLVNVAEAASIIRNIVKAIDHLHSMNIAHRDLKVRTVSFVLFCVHSSLGLSITVNTQGFVWKFFMRYI